MPKKREYYSAHRNRPPSKRKRGRPKLPKSKLKPKPLGKKALKVIQEQEQQALEQQEQEKLHQALLNFWK